MSSSGDFDSMLRAYYRRLYPFETIEKWLSYGDSRKNFTNREFSFMTKGDVYKRFNLYSSATELAQGVRNNPNVPYKLDIGPIYQTGSRVVQQRALIFDIDLND